jgi:ribosomal protein L14
MANKKISGLPATTFLLGDEIAEVVQNGLNKRIPASLFATTREFNRTFDSELLFDKNEIFYSPYVMSDDITFTVAVGGNLTDQAAVINVLIQADGTNAINFGSGFSFGSNAFLYGIVNGQILEAGTYEMFILYRNGTISVNFPGIAAQESVVVQLLAPSNFAAVADGETDIDLSWDDVSNESSYLIEYSANGTTGWTSLSTPAADATTSTQSGLTAGQTVYYRIKAIGDGVNYSDSPYSTVSATTEDSGDVTAPVGTFSPVNGNATHAINRAIVITFDEEIRNTDGSAIVSNQAGIITLKQTNSGGTNIAHSWTIDVTKKIITITPTTHYGVTQLVYVAYNNVEDVSGNEVTVAVSITFTTTDYTLMNGVSNGLDFGDIELSNLWVAADTNFWLEATLKDPDLTGTSHIVWGKHDEPGNNKTFYWTQYLTDFYFAYFSTAGMRQVKWAGCVGAGEQVFVVKYDGAIDSADGLDRLTLLKNGVTQGSKTLNITSGTLPAFLKSTGARLSAGTHINAVGTPLGNFLPSEIKDLIVRSNAGATVVINVPVVRDGTDTSGNANHGSWF